MRRAFPMTPLYRLLTALSMVVLAPYYALRAWRRGEPRGALRERFGLLSEAIRSRVVAGGSHGGAIWIHAVSVGEVLAARPLVEGLAHRFPGRAIFVSTTTETGQRLARERLDCASGIFYFPLDWTGAVRRALAGINPALVIIMETEIWPNFLRESRRRGVPVVFANARVSERSFARFERWRFLVDELFALALEDATLFLAQSREDAARLASMGAPQECIAVTGNLKYDVEPPAIGPLGSWLDSEIRRQERWPVFVAGSVVAEEEAAVLAAFDIAQRKWRHALLVLAPRKPDRFDVAAEISEQGGWTVARRSRLDLAAPFDDSADILLLDSIGELAGLYSLADAVFIGGSLVPSGGHNILEPAWFGRPPVFGESMANFRDMASQFLAARAGVQVHSGPMLGKVWVQLIEDASLRESMGRAARELADRNRGATARALDRISALLAAGDAAS
ncbi:MAG: 3-deoxy-D-manno-octulosonic acid transferase [Candidatus Acidiferrales bacterium]